MIYFLCDSYHLVYGGTFLISFSLFMLPLIKPDHFYQVYLAEQFKWLTKYFSFHPILEFSCPGGRRWASFWPAVRSKFGGGLALFQKETDISYDFCICWLFIRYIHPPHHAKQPTSWSWVHEDDTIQCSPSHVHATDRVLAHASSTAHFDVKNPRYKIDMPNL